VSEERQQTVGEYGQIPIEYDNAGEYYLPPNFTGNFIPIFQSDWREFSIWLDKTTAVTDLINDASRTISLKAAYDVSEIINYGINSIDSRLSHDYNLCEVFKQGTINEMPMNGNLRFFVIPQSNLVLNTGINPLQELKIKLNELIDAVCDSLNAGYDINDNNELIFEHVEFFENGNSYVGENIGVDTTTIVNERNGQSYAFRTKNYTHKIDNTAKSFTINGSSELFPFQSQTLDFNDEYVEDKTRTTSIPYLTNITEIIIENERVKGWVLVAAEEFSGNSYIVPNVTFNFDGKEYKGVNGFLMPLWKLLAWYRYQTDCVNISISDVVITSLSQKKIRQQEFLISYEDFENQNLVKSSIGNGKILSVEKTRGTNQIKLTLKHGI
jgi:hypothetical protein